MQNHELLIKLQPFVGTKTTFKKIANKLDIHSESLIDMMIELENEGKLKYLPLGKGFIRIGGIEGGEISKLNKEYSKSELYFNSYTNKKGNKKISINLNEELAKKLSQNNEDIINALVEGIKKEI